MGFPVLKDGQFLAPVGQCGFVLDLNRHPVSLIAEVERLYPGQDGAALLYEAERKYRDLNNPAHMDPYS